MKITSNCHCKILSSNKTKFINSSIANSRVFVILDFMEKKSRNFKKWERFLKKDKDLSQDVDIEFCAQLLANQEKFEKTILDVAKENFKKRSKNARLTSGKRNRKN